MRSLRKGRDSKKGSFKVAVRDKRELFLGTGKFRGLAFVPSSEIVFLEGRTSAFLEKMKNKRIKPTKYSFQKLKTNAQAGVMEYPQRPSADLLTKFFEQKKMSSEEQKICREFLGNIGKNNPKKDIMHAILELKKHWSECMSKELNPKDIMVLGRDSSGRIVLAVKGISVYYKGEKGETKKALVKKHAPVSKIANMTGISRATVRKVVDIADLPAVQRSKGPRKWDEFDVGEFVDALRSPPVKELLVKDLKKGSVARNMMTKKTKEIP